jgi:hypothetical protein
MMRMVSGKGSGLSGRVAPALQYGDVRSSWPRLEIDL